MNGQYFVTDAISGELTFTDDVTVDADDGFDISEAETVTLDSKWNDFFGTDEYVKFDATVAQPIKQPYVHEGRLRAFRKTTDELKNAQAQIRNLPWTMGHPKKKRITTAEEIRGFWDEPRYNDGQEASLYVPANDTEAVRFAAYNDGVSVGYSGDLDWSDDVADAIHRNMAYDHIASIPNDGQPRCDPSDGCKIHTATDDTHLEVDPEEVPSEHGHVVTVDAVRSQSTQTDEEYSRTDGIKWKGTKDGDLDVSAIPNDDYEWHYVFDGETKSKSSFPLVDADGYLRRENVITAASYSSDAPDESKLMDVLETINNLDSWDSPPLDEETLTTDSAPLAKEHVFADDCDCNHDNDTRTMTDIKQFIDEHDLSAEDIVDSLLDTSDGVDMVVDSLRESNDLDLDVHDSPTDFYDGQPDMETLAEDFDAAKIYVDEKQKLEQRVEDLNDELTEYRKQDAEAKIERLTEITDSLGTEEELREQFEEGEITVDELDEKLQIAEDILENETTTVTDSVDNGEDVIDHDRMTENGRFDLRERTK